MDGFPYTSFSSSSSVLPAAGCFTPLADVSPATLANTSVQLFFVPYEQICCSSDNLFSWANLGTKARQIAALLEMIRDNNMQHPEDTFPIRLAAAGLDRTTTEIDCFEAINDVFSEASSMPVAMDLVFDRNKIKIFPIMGTCFRLTNPQLVMEPRKVQRIGFSLSDLVDMVNCVRATPDDFHSLIQANQSNPQRLGMIKFLQVLDNMNKAREDQESSTGS